MTTPIPLRELLNETVADAEPHDDLASATLLRARTHRRNRFVAAGSALGAAAVVLGFVVVAQPFDAGSTPQPTDVASPAPTPDADGNGTVSLTLDAPRGADPQVTWIQGTTLHLTSGETVQMPKAYDNVVAYRGGYLASDASEGTIDEIQNGQVESTFPGSGLLASPDGTFVAWFASFDGPGQGDGQLDIRFANGPVRGYSESTIDIAQGLSATPISFRDQGVLYQTDNQSNGERAVWMSEGDHGTRIEGATALGGYSPNGDVAVVQTKVTDTGSCWSTYAFPGGEFAGSLTEQTCNFSLGEFSADGKYLIGWPAYADGWGPGEVAILDAGTFKPVMKFDSGEDYGVMDAVWDGDSDSLIATTYLDGTWQLLRLGTDGSIQTVSDAVVADDVSNPFRVS
jgi:hypothetical protein